MSIKKKRLRYDHICVRCGRPIAQAMSLRGMATRWEDERPEGPYVCVWPSEDTSNNRLVGLKWHEPMDPLLHAAQKAVDQ